MTLYQKVNQNADMKQQQREMEERKVQREIRIANDKRQAYMFLFLMVAAIILGGFFDSIWL